MAAYNKVRSQHIYSFLVETLDAPDPLVRIRKDMRQSILPIILLFSQLAISQTDTVINVFLEDSLSFSSVIGENIDGNNIIWHGRIEEGRSNLYLYDGSKIELLTNTYDQERISQRANVKDDQIIWVDNKRTYNPLKEKPRQDIYQYNGKEIVNMTKHLSQKEIGTIQEIQQEDDIIIWSTYDTAWQINTLQEGKFDRITKDLGKRGKFSGLQIRDGKVVWRMIDYHAQPNSAYTLPTYAYYYDGKRISILEAPNTLNSRSSRPQFCGNSIVWAINDSLENKSIYIKSGDHIKTIYQSEKSFINVKCNDREISWIETDKISLYSKLFLYKDEQIQLIDKSQNIASLKHGRSALVYSKLEGTNIESEGKVYTIHALINGSLTRLNSTEQNERHRSLSVSGNNIIWTKNNEIFLYKLATNNSD